MSLLVLFASEAGGGGDGGGGGGGGGLNIPTGGGGSGPIMSPHMLAQVLQVTDRTLDEARLEFARSIGTTRPSAPILTFNKTVDFEITTPTDGTREFVVLLYVYEQSPTEDTPTNTLDYTIQTE